MLRRQSKLREAFIKGYKRGLLEARGRRKPEPPKPTFKPREEKWYDDDDSRGLDEICFDYLEDLYSVYGKDYEGLITSLNQETDWSFNSQIRKWENRYLEEVLNGEHDEDDHSEVDQRYIQRAVRKFLKKHNILGIETVFKYKNLEDELQNGLYNKAYDSIYKLHKWLDVDALRSGRERLGR